MKIKTRIILACAVLSVSSIILSSLIIGSKSLTMSDKALKERVFQQLKSVRDLKKKQIEAYFEGIEQQVVTLAASPVVKQASVDFARIFNSADKKSNPVINTGSLERWYQDQFDAKFKQLNPNLSTVDPVYTKLGKTAKHFQGLMLTDTPKPNSGDQVNYLAYHQEYHPWLQQTQKTFGFYDVFIIEPKQGYVIYSGEKEVDFATSLDAGPFKNSGLSQAFNQAKNLKAGEVAFVDFKPYLPSYNAPAAFIATPIKQGDTLLGVLVLQIPVNTINKIMTLDGDWKAAGLGESGESFLVSQDHTLRSESRFLLQTPEAYYENLSNTGLSPSVQASIKAYQSGIGLQKADSEAVKRAIAGETGLTSGKDYRNEEVYSAYAPINIAGLNWAILSEMDESEGLQAQEQLQSSLLKLGIITALILFALAIGLGWFLGAYIAKPIGVFSHHLKTITRNKDLTLHYESKGKDEFASLGDELNQFTGDLREFFNNLKGTTQSLSQTAEDMTSNARETRSFAALQNTENDSVATAATQLEASLTQVASLTDEASDQATQTHSKCNTTNSIAETAKREMEQLASKMQSTTQTMNQLASESQAIGDVLNVIQAIAEQTNLLALNAAIEAARAGEQGRGFAVVADEVRTLAAKTADSTDEIRLKIETLQKDTDTAVKSVEESHHHTTTSIDKVEEAVKGIHFVSDQIHIMNDMSTQIATAADEQSTVTSEISQNVNKIKDMSAEILEKTSDIQSSSEQLNTISEEINQDMAKFKTA